MEFALLALINLAALGVAGVITRVYWYSSGNTRSS